MMAVVAGVTIIPPPPPTRQALQRELAGYWSARRGDYRVVNRLDECRHQLRVFGSSTEATSTEVDDTERRPGVIAALPSGCHRTTLEPKDKIDGQIDPT